MVTVNDPSTGLFNGDVGVVIEHGGRLMVAFDHAGDGGGSDTVRLLSPARLPHVETVHAMTIHKSQGSEFDHVVVVLPPPESRLASRDLLYTALTRAVDHLTIVGDRAAIEQSVTRRTSRIGGLADRLTRVDQAPPGPGEVP
jgi:exodeoxyribonuclease V alpha subunit